MNIFKNKFFLLGNLAFLLLAIPVILYFVKSQTTTTGSAAPTTTLSFINPSLTPDQCDDTQKSRLVLNPGQNVVSTVQLALKWDKAKFDIDFAPNSTAFPQVLAGPDQTSSGMTITLNIGADVTKSITTTTDIGTITIKPIAPTDGEVINLEVDPVGTKIYSLSEQDGATENVHNAAGSSPLQVSIVANTCDETTPSPSPSTSASPSPSTSASPSPSTSASTPTPTTTTANQSPLCVNLDASTSSGSAPLAVTFTATGSDTDGTLTKATFNFGNGAQQDVTTGLGTASGSAQLSYTYTSGGTFTATSVFTDNRGAVSAVCSKQVVVSGAVATQVPTATATLAPMEPTISPTATPTIAPAGDIGLTVGIIGGIILVVVAGFFLLAF